MSAVISFQHPSLVLGHIVSPVLLEQLQLIQAAQSVIDAAKDKIYSFMAMKRNLAMTINELINVNASVDVLNEKISMLDDNIQAAAIEYMQVQLEQESAIQQIRLKISSLDLKNIAASPVDFEKSVVKLLPLASSSLHMDMQYFSFEANNTGKINTLADVENYIKESTSVLGDATASEIAKHAGAQLKSQQHHGLMGTLVISASCTHPKIAQLQPLMLDADSAVDAWNQTFTDDLFIPDSPATVFKTAATSPTTDHQITILSGVARGSSFVGMVHMLQKPGSRMSDSDLQDMANDLQNKFKAGAFLDSKTGRTDNINAVVNQARILMNVKDISTHINIISMGAMPGFRSGQATPTTDGAGDATDRPKGVPSIDQTNAKTFDINTLIIAFDDYLDIIKQEDAGVPIQFYTRNVTKRDIAKAWIAKYFPNETPWMPKNF